MPAAPSPVRVGGRHYIPSGPSASPQEGRRGPSVRPTGCAKRLHSCPLTLYNMLAGITEGRAPRDPGRVQAESEGPALSLQWEPPSAPQTPVAQVPPSLAATPPPTPPHPPTPPGPGTGSCSPAALPPPGAWGASARAWWASHTHTEPEKPSGARSVRPPSTCGNSGRRNRALQVGALAPPAPGAGGRGSPPDTHPSEGWGASLCRTSGADGCTRRPSGSLGPLLMGCLQAHLTSAQASLPRPHP